MGVGQSNDYSEKPNIQLAKKILCKIKTKKGNSNGFLCRIPNPVLITCGEVFSEDDVKLVKKIDISFNNQNSFTEINIDENTKTFTIGKINDEVELNMTIIEIKPNENNLPKENFLELDYNFQKNYNKNKSKNIYLIYYKSDGEIDFSTGLIKTVHKNYYEIEYDANVDINSVGCPILFNNKVIAVQGKINSNEKLNQGILLNFLINEYKKKYKIEKKINSEETEKEITKNNDSSENVLKINRKNQQQESSKTNESILSLLKKKNLCKFDNANGKFGSGFFCKIPFPNEFNTLPVLITTNSILDENEIKNGETIKFSLQNSLSKKEIFIDESRKTYTSKKLDTTIIEIKENDGINSFLCVDDILFNSSEEEKNYENKQVYTIHYPSGRNNSYSHGKIKTIIKNNIQHSCATKEGSSGSPILNSSSLKVIGMHTKGTDPEHNIGILIKAPIKEFIDKFKNDNKNENYKNEILIKMKIEQKDIGGKIHFLGFDKALNFLKKKIKDSNGTGKMTEEYNHLIEDMEKQLLVINEKNIILYINKNNEEFKSYFNPKAEGIYTIKLIFKVKLECCLYMFWKCYNLIDINLSNFNTQNVTNMKSMFCGCINLTNINLSNFNTQNVTNMSEMFGECHNLTNIDLSNFNTQNVINMNSMFLGCNKLNIINLSNFNTQKVKDMLGMFGECRNLTNIDVSAFNTQNVTNMCAMFGGCNNLSSINLSNFNTQNVKYMDTMFYKCNKLININLSSFNTEKVNDMYGMFLGCNKLSNINLSNFNTQNVKNMKSMFCDCNNLTNINLSNFNTENVTDMKSMFGGCINLISINLSNFNTQKITNMKSMFAGCKKLTNIKVNDKLSKEKIMKVVPSSVKMNV